MTILLLVLAAAASRRAMRATGRELDLWIGVGAYARPAVLMGEDVWKRWEDFSRPSLPLFALVLWLVLPMRPRPSEAVSGRPMATSSP